MNPSNARLVPPVALTALAVAATLSLSAPAAAQSTIRAYRDRPSYGVELEPHLVLGWIEPPGVGTGQGLGLGARGTFEIVGEGFIKTINDSVGIGVGLDWVHYEGNDTSQPGECIRFIEGQNGGPVCVEVDDTGGSTDYLWIPVVMQWNFWLHRRWSVFGEPGFALRLDDLDEVGFSPFLLWGGGRFHISSNAALTLRAGIPFVITPYLSIGFSFLL